MSTAPAAPPSFQTGRNGQATQPTAPGGNWYDNSGMPIAPKYNAVYNPLTMSLLPGYQDQMAANSQGYDAYRQEALRKGPSAWANLSKQQQALEAAGEKDKGAQSTKSAAAGAMDDLAMRGGLSSGARERAAESGANNLVNMSQGVDKQENLNNMGIGISDEQNRVHELGTLPGMESQRVGQWEGVKSTDLANNLKENENLNQYNQNLYNQQMQAWAANQQAQATANSGKK